MTVEQTGEQWRVSAKRQGFATLRCGDICQITHLYVAPTCRNQGIGTKLVKQLEKIGKNQGFAEITVEFSDENMDFVESMGQFFEANGFSKPQSARTHYAYCRAQIPWKLPTYNLPHGMEIVALSQLQPQELDGLLECFGEQIAQYGKLLDMDTSLSLWQDGKPLGFVLASPAEDTLVILSLGCLDVTSGGAIYLLRQLLTQNEQKTMQTTWEVPGIVPTCEKIVYECWKGLE